MNSTGMDYNVPAGEFGGRVMGGQGPITGATVGVYAFGTSGYGSAATLLASTTTDGSGNFGFSSGAYSCPQSNTPLYLLTSGGNTGGGTNADSVLGIALGTCTVAKQNSIVVNEVTTVALAFTMAYYFNDITTGFTAGADSFGGPSVGTSPVYYSQGISLADDYTAHIIVNNSYGGANPGTNGTTIEASKIYTIANILAACVNTTGGAHTGTATVCAKMQSYTANGLSSRPYDTLQMAVMMALNPTVNVTKLYNLIATTPPFAGGLSSAPNDFSIGVSYSASLAGLDVPTAALATLDIDEFGQVWFPSNAAGEVGLGLMSPPAGGIQNIFGGSGMVNPTQVVVDNENTAWVNDYSSSQVTGVSTTSPSTTVTTFSLPGYTSPAITINDDDAVYTGIFSGTLAGLGTIDSLRSSYTAVANSTYGSFPPVSVAGDAVGGDGITVTQVTGTNGYVYHAANGGAAPVSVVTTNSYQGQTIFSGNDLLSLRTKGTTGAADGLCIYSQQACYGFSPANSNHDYGMAIDGLGTLWITESGTGSVLSAPIFSTAPGNGTDYLNAGATQKVNVTELQHGSGQGGTMITPYGIAIDVGGNVWVLNAGCVGTGCTPGNIVISEIIGAAAPTITPVAYQITQASTTTGTEPTY